MYEPSVAERKSVQAQFGENDESRREVGMLKRVRHKVEASTGGGGGRRA